jgi:AcrR family transcriptional regulator
MARTTGSHSDITGPRVRAAALRLFARHGFAAVSMRQIAAQVGVQAGALYNYTPDKQTLLFELMRGHLIELLEAEGAPPAQAPQAPQATGASPLLRLERFVRFHIAFHHDRPDAVFIAYMELRNLSPANFELIEGLRRSYEHRLEAILRDGAAGGAFEVPDPKIATLAVIAMLTGVNTWFRDGGRLTLGQVQDQYWEMVRKAVGG